MTDTSRPQKTIVVTGGAQGIGFSIAERLASSGYLIAVADLRGAADAAKRLGSGAVGFDVDVSDDYLAKRPSSQHHGRQPRPPDERSGRDRRLSRQRGGQ